MAGNKISGPLCHGACKKPGGRGGGGEVFFYRDRPWKVYYLKSILGPRNLRKTIIGLRNSAKSAVLTIYTYKKC